MDSEGNLYWNKKLPLYLKVSPTPDGDGPLLKSKNPDYSNPIYLDTEGTNYVRTRYAVNNNTGKTVQPLAEVMMPIIADGESPKSIISFQNAVKYQSQIVQYFGPGLKISITAKDKLSGVELVQYSLDESNYLTYANELNSSSEGEHTLTYFSLDKVGNAENIQKSNYTIDLTPPLLSHNVNGVGDDNIIASTSKIYFTATDNLSGIKAIYYRFDEEDFKKYDGNSVAFQALEDGSHNMEYYAIDNVDNKSIIQNVGFYYDKTAPLTASDILGDRFVVNDRIYFSGRTKMKLTAVDNKVGVKEIRYSIDNKAFETYNQPFYLPSLSGEHSIRFYSVDRLANEPSGSEKYKHNISLIYLDLTGPKLDIALSGPIFNAGETTFIGPETKLSVIGKDNESGVQYLAYSINGNQAETKYTEPFSIKTSGKCKIELFGYDNVNNRNIGSTEYIADNDPPLIKENFSTESIETIDGKNVYPSYLTLFLAATDNMTGNDRIYYSINDGPEKLYAKPISGLKKNNDYTVKIRAIDKVGNDSEKTIFFRTGN
jgi:hypothetical protein